MSWQSDWGAISRRILALESSSERLFTLSNVHSDSNTPVIERVLYPQLTSVFDELKAFAERWRDQLPREAQEVLDRLVEAGGGSDIWSTNHGKTGIGWRSVASRVLAALGIIRGEVEFLLVDPAQQAISVTERAFKQLQWLIICDKDVQAKWCTAFDIREEACEALGATHLLHHGIWAYKAHHPRQRTDLIVSETNEDVSLLERIDLVQRQVVEDTPSLRRIARALVLTEWKVINMDNITRANIETAARQGRGQARRYGGELLFGFDLRNMRYVILVTRQPTNPPDDHCEGEMIYRHLNIAVAPQKASTRIPAP